MSPQTTLRKAASLMHERAGAALGPDYEWGVDEDGESRRTWWAFTDEDHLCANGILTVRDMPPWTDRVVIFDHVTGWTPAVALAVSAWLDWAATTAEFGIEPSTRALDVARAYLGDLDA